MGSEQGAFSTFCRNDPDVLRRAACACARGKAPPCHRTDGTPVVHCLKTASLTSTDSGKGTRCPDPLLQTFRTHTAPSSAFLKDPPARGVKVTPHAQTPCRTELSVNLPVLWPALTPANGNPQPLMASFIHTWWERRVHGGWMGSHPLLHRPVPGLVLGGSCKLSFAQFPQPVTHSDDETLAA